MTVQTLIKILQKAPQRAKVVVDIKSFKQILPEWNLCHINKADWQIIEKSDDDGGTKFRKSGEVASEKIFIISGDHDWQTEELDEFYRKAGFIWTADHGWHKPKNASVK